MGREVPAATGQQDRFARSRPPILRFHKRPDRKCIFNTPVGLIAEKRVGAIAVAERSYRAPILRPEAEQIQIGLGDERSAPMRTTRQRTLDQYGRVIEHRVSSRPGRQCRSTAGERDGSVQCLARGELIFTRTINRLIA